MCKRVNTIFLLTYLENVLHGLYVLLNRTLHDKMKKIIYVFIMKYNLPWAVFLHLPRSAYLVRPEMNENMFSIYPWLCDTWNVRLDAVWLWSTCRFNQIKPMNAILRHWTTLAILRHDIQWQHVYEVDLSVARTKCVDRL